MLKNLIKKINFQNNIKLPINNPFYWIITTLLILIVIIFYTMSSKKIETDQFILIAHAGGEINGRIYTNSLEALDTNYKKGFRYFELDFEATSDGHYVLIHDWNKTYKNLFKKKEKPSIKQFLSYKMIDNLTQMTLNSLIEWLKSHDDAIIITDFKTDNIKGLNYINNHYPEFKGNFIPQIYSIFEYKPVKSLGFKKIILTLYRTKIPKEKVLRFASINRIYAITMPKEWILESDFASKLYSSNINVFTHTVNKLSLKKAFINHGVIGFYTDFIKPEKE